MINIATNRYSKIFGNSANNLKAPDFVKTSNANYKAAKHPTISTAKAPVNQQKGRGLFDMLNLNNIEMDSDRSMLLMMLALLSGKDNETDELLMLALMYIML